jgi:hypothetical protein
MYIQLFNVNLPFESDKIMVFGCMLMKYSETLRFPNVSLWLVDQLFPWFLLAHTVSINKITLFNVKK